MAYAELIPAAAPLRRTVGDRSIDNLAFARLLRLIEGRENSNHQKQTATRIVTNNVQRRNRFSLGAYCCGNTGQRNVVEVVACRMSKGSRLAPTSHAPKDNFGVALQANIRAKSRTLRNTGAIAFKNDVSLFNHFEKGFESFRIAYVQRNAFLAAGVEGSAMEFGFDARSTTITSAPRSARIWPA